MIPKNSNDVLTDMQIKFIDNYFKNGKNGSKAAIDAGYSPKSAKAAAQELLHRHPIASAVIRIVDTYIETRKEELYLEAKQREKEYREEQNLRDIAIMSGKEVMQRLSEIARGHVNDQFDLPPTLKDQTEALKEVAKRTIDQEIKLEEYKKQKPDITINIIKREKKEQDNDNGIYI